MRTERTAARQAREAALPGEDPDAGINMGTYNYPVLMAVDILIMEADLVPVGRDQAQHVEIAADIAGSFNHLYGSGYRFRIPEVPEEDYLAIRTVGDAVGLVRRYAFAEAA